MIVSQRFKHQKMDNFYWQISRCKNRELNFWYSIIINKVFQCRNIKDTNSPITFWGLSSVGIKKTWFYVDQRIVVSICGNENQDNFYHVLRATTKWSTRCPGHRNITFSWAGLTIPVLKCGHAQMPNLSWVHKKLSRWDLYKDWDKSQVTVMIVRMMINRCKKISNLGGPMSTWVRMTKSNLNNH